MNPQTDGGMDGTMLLVYRPLIWRRFWKAFEGQLGEWMFLEWLLMRERERERLRERCLMRKSRALDNELRRGYLRKIGVSAIRLVIGKMVMLW